MKTSIKLNILKNNMGTKQTAVDWIFNQLYLNDRARYNDIIEKAKQMEKEQIINAWISGDESDGISDVDNPSFALKYYDKTYGNHEKN